MSATAFILAFVLALSAASPAEKPQAFCFRGQVIVRNPTKIILRETDDHAVSITTNPACSQDCEEGDIVEVSGRMSPRTFNRQQTFRADRIVKTGHADLPRPLDVTGCEVGDGRHLYRFVRVQGVIASAKRSFENANWNWLTLRTATGPVGISARQDSYPLDHLLRLIDAEVAVVGIVVYSWGTPSSLGAHLSLRGSNAIQTLTTAPTDPFSAPDLTTSDEPHRQRLDGTVVAAGRTRFFLKKEGYGLIAIHPSPGMTPPPVGSAVTVAGFAEMDPVHLRLVNSIYRKRDNVPVPTSGTDLQPIPDDLQKVSFGNRLIRTTAQVLNLPAEDDASDTITLVCQKRVVYADISLLETRATTHPRPGSTIEITGVCSCEFENASALDAFPRIRRTVITPRTAADIVILHKPSWWTPLRLMVVIGVLLLVLAAILVWNWTLRTISERRGRELAREQLRHATSELKVEERTRLAVELHDSISQTLTGVALQIDAAQGSAGSPAVSGRFLDTARAMLASCRQELRCCIWDLKSRTFDENDMTEAVTRTLAPHLGDVEAQVRFNVPRNILSESATHDILRIVRELAINAIRHGRAKRLRIAGEYRNGLVRFSVRDDGDGFDPKDIPGPAQGHFGLQGIRERISGRNGSVMVESSPGKGTKITVAFAPDEKDEDGQ